jgi:NAD(P)H-dependent flavin oxidoreductase YrpB (nitropropane dioxygenase family)
MGVNFRSASTEEDLMRTKVTEMFGIETPIFAFSHCSDVVVEATNAGGMGVLGTTRLSPEQLEEELRWIDNHTNGRPYALDLALPNKLDPVRPMKDREIALPREHVEFIEKILDEAGIPPLPPDEHEKFQASSPGYTLTSQGGMELIDVALKHPQIKLVVSALGVAPKERIDLLHERGLMVGALVGNVRHAVSQMKAGIDLLVAQGMEAGAIAETLPRWSCGHRSSMRFRHCHCPSSPPAAVNRHGVPTPIGTLSY